MMPQNWKTIYTTNQSYKIAIGRAILEEHGIACVEFNNKDNSYQFGEYHLCVHQNDVLKAINILKQTLDDI